LPTTFSFFFEYFCLLTLSKKKYLPNNIRNFFSDEIAQFDRWKNTVWYKL
jgi:hypothetical protein